jgi:ATP-dependent Lon protease
VEEYLDNPIFLPTEELSQRISIPGVVPGLAWTPYGGDILFVEATSMPGNRGFQITGSIGNVMNESARAALSYVRSRSSKLGLHDEFFSKSDIHLHIPSGAQPKDGPSAGVTIATALVSLASGRKMKPLVGMTGEITLRGQVLRIGGVKEKVLAGHRIGLKTIILPRNNAQDLDDVPDEVKKEMKFVFVETVDEVLESALEPAPALAAKPASKKKSETSKAKKHAKNPAR